MSARRQSLDIPPPSKLAAGSDVMAAPYRWQRPIENGERRRYYVHNVQSISLPVAYLAVPVYSRDDELAYSGSSGTRWDFATFNDRERGNVFAENGPYPEWYRLEHIALLFEAAGYDISEAEIAPERRKTKERPKAQRAEKAPQTVFTFERGMVPA